MRNSVREFGRFKVTRFDINQPWHKAFQAKLFDPECRARFQWVSRCSDVAAGIVQTPKPSAHRTSIDGSCPALKEVCKT